MKIQLLRVQHENRRKAFIGLAPEVGEDRISAQKVPDQVSVQFSREIEVPEDVALKELLYLLKGASL